jgi:hypothetical protein
MPSNGVTIIDFPSSRDDTDLEFLSDDNTPSLTHFRTSPIGSGQVSSHLAMASFLSDLWNAQHQLSESTLWDFGRKLLESGNESTPDPVRRVRLSPRITNVSKRIGIASPMR